MEEEGVGRRGLMETEITFKELQQQGVFENEQGRPNTDLKYSRRTKMIVLKIAYLIALVFIIELWWNSCSS